jgi:hypothetical protein
MKKNPLLKRVLARIFTSSDYIPRRHFHISTTKQRSQSFLPIFYNRTIRRFLFAFAKLLALKGGIALNISRSINYRLALTQEAPDVETFQYLDFKDQDYRTIDYGFETRPSIITKAFQSAKSVANISEDSFLWAGIAVLENGLLQTPAVRKSDIHIQITVTGTNNQNKELYLILPVDMKKHAIAHNHIGRNWIDFSVDLQEFKNQTININLQAFFRKDTFTIHHEKEKEGIVKSDVPCVAWSAPQIIVRKPIKEKRNILLISGESMVDPFWLQKETKQSIDLPNLLELREESSWYQRTYSQVDSTLPFALTVQTGLFPSQHHFGNYQQPIYTEAPSQSIVFLSELLKKDGFTTVSRVAYPRFDSLYGWVRKTDSYYQADLPSDSNAPNSGQIIRTLDMFKEQDCFLFSHLTRLHSPLLSFDDTQTPRMHKAELISRAKELDILPLYMEQMVEYDRQIGDIVSYLKRTGQFENTMILLIGDHGPAIPPKWHSTKVNYAHYEEHSRVPLMIKYPNWADQPARKIDTPTSAQFEAFSSILGCLGIKQPDYFAESPQNDKKYGDFAITETVYHPKHEHYAVSFTSREYKYWLMAEVDWKNFKLKQILEERLYPVLENGHVDEKESVLQKNPKIGLAMKGLALEFFGRNMEFRQNHPTVKFPNNMRV